MRMRRFMVTLKDRPGSATVLVALILAVHIAAASRWKIADTPRQVRAATELVAVYAGFAGVAALVAGFVGVIVVFSTLTGKAWSQVRNLGGRSLVRNWTSPIRCTLLAALLSIAAALGTQTGHPRTAWWTFELAVLFTIASGLRILWLLNGLLRVQQNIDRAEAQEAKVVPLEALGLRQRQAP